MKMLLYYLSRWRSTNSSYLLKNTLSTLFIFLLTAYAVRDGVFQEFAATKSCLFAVLMCAIWSGTFNSIALFYSEADYMTDDLNKFLPVHTYIFGNILIQVFLCMVEALLCSTVFMLFFDYDLEGIVFPNTNLDYCVTFFLILLSADTLGFCVGMIVKNITSAMSIIPVILIVQFLFSGCLFRLNGVLNRLSEFTTAKWGFSGLGSIADLNGYAVGIPASPLFQHNAEFVLFCWRQMLFLSVAFILCAGLLLFLKINKKS